MLDNKLLLPTEDFGSIIPEDFSPRYDTVFGLEVMGSCLKTKAFMALYCAHSFGIPPKDEVTAKALSDWGLGNICERAAREARHHMSRPETAQSLSAQDMEIPF